jgi:hypothetical protein
MACVPDRPRFKAHELEDLDEQELTDLRNTLDARKPHYTNPEAPAPEHRRFEAFPSASFCVFLRANILSGPRLTLFLVPCFLRGCAGEEFGYCSFHSAAIYPFSKMKFFKLSS